MGLDNFICSISWLLFFNKLRNAPCTPPRETPWIVSEGSISNGRSWASLTERESLPILSGKRSRHSRSVKVKGYADQTSVTRAHMIRRTLTVDILLIIGVWDEPFLLSKLRVIYLARFPCLFLSHILPGHSLAICLDRKRWTNSPTKNKWVLSQKVKPGQLDRIKAQKETNIYTYLFNISPQK